MVVEKFQIHAVKITGKCIFTHVPKQNFPPGSYHYHSTGGNYPFPRNNDFYIFPQQKGRRIMEIKK